MWLAEVIVDSSAVVAIIRSEPDKERCLQQIETAAVVRMSAANFLEAATVVDATHDSVAIGEFDDFVRGTPIVIEPVTAFQARIAREAYRTFGRGSGHPAKLNFGDCFAYALAKELDEPLLFIGQDFVHTDIRRVLT